MAREAYELDTCRLQFRDGSMSVCQLTRKGLKVRLSTLTKDNVDVTFKIGDSFTYKAHKCLLKECIPYFRGMFSHDFQETELSDIKLSEDVEAVAMKKLMAYIYNGTVNVSASEVPSVFQLADQWGMTGLKDACSAYMYRELDASNCLDRLQLAEMYSCAYLANGCRRFIAEKYPAVSLTNAFLESSSALLINVLNLPNLNPGPLREDFVFDSVFRWLQHDLKNRRACLPDLVEYLNLPAVTTEMKYKWKQEFMRFDGVFPLQAERRNFFNYLR